MITNIPLPEKKYRAVIIDPPWPIDVKMPYQTMSLMEIAQLPVRKLLEKDARVYVWVTNSMMPEVFGLLNIWRLRYDGMITWCKNYGLGRPPYTATEHCIMCSVGQPPRPHMLEGNERILNWFKTDFKLRHSQKPDSLHKIVEELNEGPYLEMFARQSRPGWDCWGNEVETQSTEEQQ
jgi:N6-adenosine-specific RNA methylase IME4